MFDKEPRLNWTKLKRPLLGCLAATLVVAQGCQIESGRNLSTGPTTSSIPTPDRSFQKPRVAPSPSPSPRSLKDRWVLGE